MSYGDPQSVEVSARKSLGDVRLRYRINDGKLEQAPSKAAPGGERFNNEKGVYFERLRGEGKGTQPGDEVEVWFESKRGPEHSRALHLHGTGRRAPTRSSSSRPRTTWPATPRRTPDGPHYLSYYTDALDEAGVGDDVYDVDRMGHQAPDALGGRSHYDAVVCTRATTT